MPNIIALVVTHQRPVLTKICIKRLMDYQTLALSKTVLVGTSEADKVDFRDTVFIKHENRPLSLKWQAGLEKAREFNPDAILIVGSDDFLSNDWVENSWNLMQKENAGLTGRNDLYVLNFQKHLELTHWKGYKRESRKDEPIGLGRLISKDILDKIDWKLWAEPLNDGLDREAYRNLVNAKVKSLVLTDNTKCLDVKSSEGNIWKFKQIKGEIIAEINTWLDTYFNDLLPELEKNFEMKTTEEPMGFFKRLFSR